MIGRMVCNVLKVIEQLNKLWPPFGVLCVLMLFVFDTSDPVACNANVFLMIVILHERNEQFLFLFFLKTVILHE
jgi:hypothetical protein